MRAMVTETMANHQNTVNDPELRGNTLKTVQKAFKSIRKYYFSKKESVHFMELEMGLKVLKSKGILLLNYIPKPV